MSPAFHDLMADKTDFLRVREETLNEAASSTLWWPLARSRGVGNDTHKDLLSAFIGDVQCCHAAYAMDHFSPQSLFATYATRGIDLVISVSKLDAGLERLAARVPSTAPEGQCKLSSEKNSAKTNAGSLAAGMNLPSSSELRAALTEDHIRQLCKIYAQDYACFSDHLSLPPECPTNKLPATTAPFPPAPPRPPPPPVVEQSTAPSHIDVMLPPLPPFAPMGFIGGDLFKKPPPPPVETSPLARLNPLSDQENLAGVASVVILVLVVMAVAGWLIMNKLGLASWWASRRRKPRAAKRKRPKVVVKRRGASSRDGRQPLPDCTAVVLAENGSYDDLSYLGDASAADVDVPARRARRKRHPERNPLTGRRAARELLPTEDVDDEDASSIEEEPHAHSRHARNKRSSRSGRARDREVRRPPSSNDTRTEAEAPLAEMAVEGDLPDEEHDLD